MNRDTNVRLMDELMGALTQSDWWMKERDQNPEIQAAENRLSEALEAINGAVAPDMIGRIEDAAYSYTTAVEYAAILYGIHIADAIRDVAARPADLSRYIRERIEVRQ